MERRNAMPAEALAKVETQGLWHVSRQCVCTASWKTHQENYDQYIASDTAPLGQAPQRPSCEYAYRDPKL
jgi:hypothetical protein